MLRLAIETDALREEDLATFLVYLPEHEQAEVARFKQLDDRKRALARYGVCGILCGCIKGTSQATDMTQHI